MPFYEYACDDCRIIYKTRHGIDAAGPDKCPKCEASLRKVLSAPYLNTRNYSSPTEAKYANLSVSDEIAKEKAGSVKVAKVNVDDNQSLSMKYNVRAIPALLFFKNGQLRDQVIGMTSKKDLLGRLDALA